jgi:putative ABC transport system permease protein
MMISQHLDSLIQDVRYGLRVLRQSPVFTAVAVLSLSLGIGAAAAVFNVADAVLFRSLAVRDSQDLRSFQASLTFGGPSSRKDVYGADQAEIEALARAADFADLAGFRTVDDVAVAIGGGDPRALRAEFVSPSYFAVVGAKTVAGRLLDASDRGPAPVPLVMSERLWRTACAADAQCVGRAASINNHPAVIVGVAGEFRGLTAERPADVFLPLEATPVVEPAAAFTVARIVMRLRPGMTTPVAEQRMAALYQGLGPSMARGAEVKVTLPDAGRGISDVRDGLRLPLTLGIVLVSVLLLVACANTGGLLVARFAGRQTEFGIRIAIGAGRGRLVRQLVVEALILATLAGAAALLFAAMAAPLLASAIPFSAVPVAFEIRFDARLVGFTTAVAAAAALIAGGMSLRHVVRTELSAVLNAGSRSVVRGRRRAMDVLIAAQIGCSLLLLVATGAMTRTLTNLRHVDPGFDPSNAIAITVDASASLPDRGQAPAYFSRLYEHLAPLTEAGQVTISHLGLLGRGMTTGAFDVPGWTPREDEDRLVRLFFVGPHFFETVGMRIVAGDGLTPADMTRRDRVAVVTQQFARFFFGAPERAVGRFLSSDVRIVGVVADAKYNTFRDAPVRAVFLPFTQAPPRQVMTIIARPAGDQRRAREALAAAIASYDRRAKTKVTTLADQVNAVMGLERFAAAMAAVLAGLALFLSCAGVYSTVAYAVSERRQELALRFALGATTTDIVRLVLRQPLRVTLIGMAAATPATYAVMRMASALLFGVAPLDLPALIVSTLALGVTAAGAAALPAWRAAVTDPHECLRAS